jgi:hypothetical protein
MKTRYIVYKTFGSSLNCNTLDFATNHFETCLNSISIVDNETGRTLKKREHILQGFIFSGIRHMGKISIVKCSDNGELITRLGEKFECAFNRIKRITKNRRESTVYTEDRNDFSKRRLQIK